MGAGPADAVVEPVLDLTTRSERGRLGIRLDDIRSDEADAITIDLYPALDIQEREGLADTFPPQAMAVAPYRHSIYHRDG